MQDTTACMQMMFLQIVNSPSGCLASHLIHFIHDICNHASKIVFLLLVKGSLKAKWFANKDAAFFNSKLWNWQLHYTKTHKGWHPNEISNQVPRKEAWGCLSSPKSSKHINTQYLGKHIKLYFWHSQNRKYPAPPGRSFYHQKSSF